MVIFTYKIFVSKDGEEFRELPTNIFLTYNEKEGDLVLEHWNRCGIRPNLSNIFWKYEKVSAKPATRQEWDDADNDLIPFRHGSCW